MTRLRIWKLEEALQVSFLLSKERSQTVVRLSQLQVRLAFADSAFIKQLEIEICLTEFAIKSIDSKFQSVEEILKQHLHYLRVSSCLGNRHLVRYRLRLKMKWTKANRNFIESKHQSQVLTLLFQRMNWARDENRLMQPFLLLQVHYSLWWEKKWFWRF